MQTKRYPYIFVPGMSGWGDTSSLSKIFPYWGFFGYGILSDLRRRGYEAYAASVSPLGSAWDRACELYAQLVGGTVDYGKAHSERYGHARFGVTYERPFFAGWGEKDADGDVRKVHMISHSFGGDTVRILSYLLSQGSEEERAATTDGSLSPLFAGGNGGRIFSITTLAAPHDGTDMQHALGKPLAFLMKEGYFTFNYVMGNTPLRAFYDAQLGHFGIGKPSKTLGIAEMHRFARSYDNVFRDVSVDGSMAINRMICAQDDVYYFSYAVCGTSENSKGVQFPNKAMLPGLALFAALIGRHKETTDDGYVCDDDWMPNDGVVNTLSAKAPSTEPSVEYQKGMEIRPGIWHVMPVIIGNHGSVIGWSRPKEMTMPLYLSQLKRLDALAEKSFAAAKG